MKKITLFIAILLISTLSMAQKKEKLHLTNALVIAQLDNPEDRYTLEINMTELLTSRGVKAFPSLNYMKQGGDSQVLASDSVQKIMLEAGVDTYVIITIRGYDKRFKKSKRKENLETSLSEGGIFDLYRTDIVSISFEFKFYRNGEMVYSDIRRCGNISDRPTVIKRFRKKVGKRIYKWMK